MSCDDVMLALPVLSGGDPVEAERVRAHARECPACGEALRAFERDEALFGALRRERTQRGGALPKVMDGFTASVMAQVARERAAGRSLGPVAEAAAPAAQEPAGLVIRLRMRVIAAAAVALICVLIGNHGAAPAPSPVAVRPGDAPRPTTTPATPTTPTTPATPQAAPRAIDPNLAALPAPRRVDADPAPMPRRARRAMPAGGGGGVVPVSGGRSGPSFGPGAAPPDELLEWIEGVLPGIQRRLLDGQQRPGQAAREVHF